MTSRVVMGMVAVAAVVAWEVTPGAQQPAPGQQPGTRLSVEQLQAQMFRVSAGRRMKPKSWPNGARVAVGLTFDVDNVSPGLANGNLLADALSRGEYGAIDGLPRILRLLDRYQLPGTFYIPAVSQLMHPQIVPSIMASGRHEIGVHGWIHENLPALNDAAREQQLLNQAIDALTKATGKRPVGYRAPVWQFSEYTAAQIKAAGFLYDSSLQASDDPYELLVDRQPTGVIELPIDWLNDDNAYFGGVANGSLPDPDAVERIFESEFDQAYEEGGLFNLTMHPHVTGHRSRIAGFERLIRHMKSKPGVWFATEEDIARYVKSHAGS
jgi:peptidoglycan/xylan/chitin deacetylase (PgdA/CDA1 family)